MLYVDLKIVPPKKLGSQPCNTCRCCKAVHTTETVMASTPELQNGASPVLGEPAMNNNTQSIADYLAQLLKDKKQLAAFPNVFVHLERLLDDGKRRQPFLSSLFP